MGSSQGHQIQGEMYSGHICSGQPTTARGHLWFSASQREELSRAAPMPCHTPPVSAPFSGCPAAGRNTPGKRQLGMWHHGIFLGAGRSNSLCSAVMVVFRWRLFLPFISGK